jgi:hypothetical protein
MWGFLMAGREISTYQTRILRGVYPKILNAVEAVSLMLRALKSFMFGK